MSAIKGSTEVARSPEDVFAYSVDVAQRKAWQSAVLEIEQETPGPPGSGTRVREKRRVTGGPRTFAWEFTDYEPPARWGFRTLDGPVRPHGTVTLAPRDGGAATHVEFELEFAGHGIGKLFAPLARRGARQQVESDLGGLKRELEAGRPPADRGGA